MFKGLFKKSKKTKSITFATSVWEKDYRYILGENGYLQNKMIDNHNFLFSQKLLIINNVQDYDHVYKLAKKKIDKGIITKVIIAKEHEQKLLGHFSLTKEHFTFDDDPRYDATDEWVYYNAIAPLSAIFHCETDYLLYHTGDTHLIKKSNWIDDAIYAMEKNRRYKVANLNWKDGADILKESHKKRGKFYISKKGFSDQLFLVSAKDFKQPIYSKVRSDLGHFPRGNTFEKRVFSHMKNNRWLRLTHKDLFYISDNLY